VDGIVDYETTQAPGRRRVDQQDYKTTTREHSVRAARKTDSAAHNDGVGVETKLSSRAYTHSDGVDAVYKDNNTLVERRATHENTNPHNPNTARHVPAVMLKLSMKLMRPKKMSSAVMQYSSFEGR
jgi:hypothetical protein